MDKRGINNRIYIFVLIIIFLSFSIIAEDSYNPDLDKKVLEAIAQINTKGDNYKYSDFQSLESGVKTELITENLNELMPLLRKSDISVFDRKSFLKNYYEDILKGFDSEKFDSKKRAELFYDRDDKNTDILDDEAKNKLWIGIKESERELMLKDLINRAFETGKGYEGALDSGKPELKTVSLKDSDKIKWQGRRLIGEKGGSQDFDGDKIQADSPSDSLHPNVVGFKYENGKFIEEFKTGREVSFSEGNLKWKKETNEKTKETTRHIYYSGKDGKIVGEKKGLSLSYGAVDKTKGESSVIDIEYNKDGNVEFKMSGKPEQTYVAFKDQFNNQAKIGMSDNKDADGNYKTGILEVRSGESLALSGNSKVTTVGLGEHKVKEGNTLVLGGSYFDSTKEGFLIIDENLKKLVGEKTGEAFVTVLSKTLQEVTKKSIFNAPMDSIKGAFKAGSEAAKQEPDKIIQGLISRKPESLKSGESYLSINLYQDLLSKDAILGKEKGKVYSFIEISAGGKGIDLDVTNSYAKINRIYIDNEFSKAGDEIFLKDGKSYIKFQGDKTFINNVGLSSKTNFYNLNTAVPIDKIVNEKSDISWKIQKNSYDGKFDFFSTSIQGSYVVKGETHVFGPRGGDILGTQIVVNNAPKDPNMYAGDFKDASVSIKAVGERIEGGIGRPGGIIDKVISKQGAKQEVSTEVIAGEMSNLFISSIDKSIKESGGVGKFQSTMSEYANIKDYSTQEKEKIMPGYSNMIDDTHYIWNNPDKVDETFRAISNAQNYYGRLSRGNPITYTMDKGAYIGGNHIQGTDPIVVRLIASGIFYGNNQYENLGTLKQAQAYQSYLDYKYSSGPKSFSSYKKNILEQSTKQPAVKSN
ncbi:MAG: hypothetical protein Q8N99_04880 [Nanoarchaeota archaeon]|nr:hypothetical protein [Nanoarchaeota archaeon]